MLDQFVGADVDLARAEIRGGCYPDDITAWITQLYGPAPGMGYLDGIHHGLDKVAWFRTDPDGTITYWPYPGGEGCPTRAIGYGTVAWKLDATPNEPVYLPNGDPNPNFQRTGNCVAIEYEGGWVHGVMHLQDPVTLNVGDAVTPDTILGLVGTTGFSGGPHTHEFCSLNGYEVDPLVLWSQVRPAGYRPPVPPPTGCPQVWFDGFRGVGEQWWQYDFGMTIRRAQNGSVGAPAYIGFIPEGIGGDGNEHYRLRIENW